MRRKRLNDEELIKYTTFCLFFVSLICIFALVDILKGNSGAIVPFLATLFTIIVMVAGLKVTKQKIEIKKNGKEAHILNKNIKIGLGDIKIKGEYTYLGKTYKFYKEYEPKKKSKSKNSQNDFLILKEKGDSAELKIKVNADNPKQYVILVS